MNTTTASLLARYRTLSPARRRFLLLFVLCTGVLALSWLGKTAGRSSPKDFPRGSAAVAGSTGIERDRYLKEQWERIKQAQKMATAGPPHAEREVLTPLTDGPGDTGPMIAHAAELGVSTKEFGRARTNLEEILERHHAYAAKLRMVGQPGASSLTATLRVPSSEFTAAVNDLKTLGKVEQEEQTADEITQRHADVEARLVNAQNTLERLQAILNEGGKVRNLLEVQRQLANVSGEVARLEAERISNEHQVTFAQVLLSLREEVNAPAESVATEIRAAAVAGSSDVLNSLLAILLFVVSRGPVTLLWVAVVFFPVRWIWRKWHPASGPQQGLPQGA
ncbi:MAG TPA: DUF4349 domain-containing protein [Candidatus Acidoferrum sp.]|nr:DUF4349 domain-containing protein [Candidatus Acidoferrum sp.]